MELYTVKSFLHVSVYIGAPTVVRNPSFFFVFQVFDMSDDDKLAKFHAEVRLGQVEWMQQAMRNIRFDEYKPPCSSRAASYIYYTRRKKFLKETSFQVRDGLVKRAEARQG